MNVFKNRILIKIIVSICLFFTLFNFTGTTRVYAEEDDDLGWGGVLITPITSLMTAIGDAIMEILHNSMQEQQAAIIKVTGHEEWWEKMSTVIAIVAAIIAVVVIAAVAIIATGGAAAGAAALAGGAAKAAFIAGATKAAGSAALIGIIGGTVAGFAAKSAMIPDDMYIPAFSMTAEKIFSNQIHIFDVNFFRSSENARKYEIYKNETRTETVSKTEKWIYESYKENDKQEYEYLESNISRYDNFGGTRYTVYQAENLKPLFQKINEKFGGTIIPYNEEDTTSYILCSNSSLNENSWSDEKGSIFTSKFEGYVNIYDENGDQVFYVTYIKKYNTYEKGDISYSYEEELRVDILKDGSVNVTESNLVQVESTAQQLRGIISSWYFILRNIALLVLMLLLIYSGIRIVIGSTAGEKAKYKERIMDWLVSICLVMVMHYIMVFAVEMVESIVDYVAATQNGNYLYLELTEVQEKNAKKVLKDFNTIGNAKDKDGNVGKGAIAYYDENGNRLAEHGVLIWHTDLAGLFRIQAQLTEEGTGKWVAYSFCYVVLVLFTLFFAFTYIKRVIYMAFLTMVAPLVAMTYPFDKITDGKAQAFNTWLKEYIFNLMIQPLHLLLYTILVSSAYMLASENAIYALVAVGFMMPAEKLMRKFFGFEKAKTPGLLGGAAGAAIAMSGLQGLLKRKPHGGKSENGKSGDANKVRFANKNKGNAMDDMTGMKPGAKVNTGKNATPAANQAKNNQNTAGNSAESKQDWDSRLTQEQKDEMMAEGISPGDEEYEGYLKQFGIDPNEDGIDEDDMLANTTLGSEDWDHDGFGSANLGDGPEIASSEAPETSSDQVAGNSESGAEEKNKRHIWRAIGVASLGVGRQAAAGVLRGIHPLRLAGKVAAGATAATAGLLIGTASGDPSKAFQYTTAGAMAGSAFASSLSGRKGLDAEKIRQEAEMAYFGPEYKAKLIERQKKEFQTSSQNISYLQQVMGVSHSEAKQILESTGSDCFNNGITDIKDVATIHKLMYPNGSKKEMEFGKAAAARTYAKRRLGGADASQMTDDKVREYQARWAKEFEERYNISRQKADELAKKAFEAAADYNKKYSDLTKR